MEPAVNSYLLGQINHTQLHQEDDIEEEILTHSYMPSTPPRDDSEEMDLLTFATINRNSYESEVDTTKKVIEAISNILQGAEQAPNQRDYINEGYEKEQQFMKPKPGHPYIIYSCDYEAYEFLKKPEYYNGNSLNRARIDEDIDKLRREAAKNFAIAQVFAEIICNDEFKNDPQGYIDRWRIKVIAESTVLERFESFTRKTSNGSESGSCIIS